ncbi:MULTISPECIES: Type 1 glutamine amidotransferase-like domain-containing protein [unclassified Moritella]|uniref:Type 1 glutamine amidotransferase-like domain-containing protein n=1 Tax=unclassified Moritella TaxID=2637987 RepID=UPI001BA4EB9B|nr:MULTISPECIES: Type 1 glutamine amidotransferase-like domain-containing protein [unclassified Moritella]QUM80443.1 Type 1 glutamine amidotransferase-like domain-containing protein [Moritella sp. 5]QUM84706.1 Type 1 glutamine amidotransferase-like domain-containing protein [Moritella sp. 28]QUM88955.1 Type 1 glutamine amidotransferase-like domain-containing protein [Moritella sp. 36]
MKKLFLASSFTDVVELFVQSEKTELKGKTVTFIPTASIHEEVTFYVDAGKKVLQDLGLIIDVLEISTATKNEISSKLESNDFIYISGGNTFFLLKELRRTGADELIKEQINRGKPYIGESAGSVILSPNIEYVKEMDDFNAVADLVSFSSLSVIDFYPLPHYTNFPFQESTQKIMSNYMDAINLIPFSNAQVILVDGDKVELVSI